MDIDLCSCKSIKIKQKCYHGDGAEKKEETIPSSRLILKAKNFHGEKMVASIEHHSLSLAIELTKKNVHSEYGQF